MLPLEAARMGCSTQAWPRGEHDYAPTIEEQAFAMLPDVVFDYGSRIGRSTLWQSMRHGAMWWGRCWASVLLAGSLLALGSLMAALAT
eukprot:14029837-Alexandrium_andersonii.AAC.1